jgi:hypothetical protein
MDLLCEQHAEDRLPGLRNRLWRVRLARAEKLPAAAESVLAAMTQDSARPDGAIPERPAQDMNGAGWCPQAAVSGAAQYH